jgi:methyltransferase-like protein
MYICVVAQVYMTTYNTNIHEQLEHKYTRPLTKHIYTTTYITHIHDHLQDKYTRPLTTQIYITTYNTNMHEQLQHKYTRHLQHIYTRPFTTHTYTRPLTTHIYTTTYNTSIHDHLQHKYTHRVWRYKRSNQGRTPKKHTQEQFEDAKRSNQGPYTEEGYTARAYLCCKWSCILVL